MPSTPWNPSEGSGTYSVIGRSGLTDGDPVKAVEGPIEGITTREFALRLTTQARRHVAYLNGWFAGHRANDPDVAGARNQMGYIEPLLLLIEGRIEELAAAVNNEGSSAK